MSQSISFDRAADYYDETRSLPDHLMEQLVPLLVAQLPREGRCLEIGVGTGRIALPLMEHGVDVVGVDISLEMVRRYVGKAQPRVVKVAIADATCLPFEDHAFSSAVASHVLHLIPGWKKALDELVRVVAPGGVLLASRSADSRAEWDVRVRRHFFVEAGDPPWPPGMSDIQELDAEMRARGAGVNKLEDVTSTVWLSIAELLDMLEKGLWSACWSIQPETRRQVAASTRAWAAAEFGDLDAKRATGHASDWRAYRLPK